jgi:AraC-like DNA-binding protein
MNEILTAVRNLGEIYVDDRLVSAIDVSTNKFPTLEQFDVFRDVHRNVAEIDLVRSQDDSFPAHQVVWDLGRLIFTSTELPGKGYAHRWRHLRKASLDHWYVTIPFCRCDAGRGHGDVMTEPPSLHCLAKPFEAETEEDGLLTLYMPHDLFPAMPALDLMLDVQLDGGRGLLLSDYLLLLNRSLSELSVAEVPHVVEATRCLVAACLVPMRDRFAEAQKPIDTVIMERARRFISRKLADPELTPEMLCTELGVSRSRLYRLFESLGGISAYIRRQRLLKTRDALSDSSDRRSISRIAEEWGFTDPSAYSRTFRHEFGVSPSEAREAGWGGYGYVIGQEKHNLAEPERSLGHLLRALSI